MKATCFGILPSSGQHSKKTNKIKLRENCACEHGVVIHKPDTCAVFDGILIEKKNIYTSVYTAGWEPTILTQKLC
jgi:hypothetical protein